MKRVILAAMIALMPASLWAHKVLMSAFPSGKMIEGDLGLSDGTMAQGQEVIVTDANGRQLGVTVTNAEGFFTFTPTEPIAHHFSANMGAGHIGTAQMSAEEVAAILGKAPVVTAPQTGTSSPSFAPDEQERIAALIRDEIRPLRREIAAAREQANLQSVIGGIGYIVGIFGLGFYLAARRKLGS